MADPITAGLVIMTVAGGAMKTVSQIAQGKQQAANAEYNAKVAEQQAQAARENAKYQQETLTQQSEYEQARIQREKQKTQATQRTLYAKSGVRLDEGSPLEVMADTAAQYEMDIAANQYNLGVGLEEIRYNTDVDVSRLKSEAAYQRTQKKAYKTASYWNAGSTILTTLGTAGTMMGGLGGGSVAKGSHSQGTKALTLL